MTNDIGILFEMASQYKFRYPYKGLITTEDLWDLSADQLDMVYKALNKELNTIEEEGLIQTKSAAEGVKANELKNKLMLVKYIFTSKQQAAELNRIAAENAQKRQQILDILAQKRESDLQNMSEDQLMELLKELG